MIHNREMAYAVEEYTSWLSLQDLKKDWNELALSQGDFHPFQLYDWHSAWWSAFSEGRELSIWIVRENDSVVGIIPLTKTHLSLHRIKVRTTTFLGTDNHASDYVMPLFSDSVPEDIQAKYLSEIFSKIETTASMFTNIRVDLPLLPLLKTAIQSNSLKTVTSVPFSAHQYILKSPEDFNTITQRKSLKRAYRYFSQLPSYQVTHTKDADEISSQLEAFFEQHEERWQDTITQSQFQDPAQRSFYKNLVKEMSDDGHILFSALHTESTPIAFHFGFHIRDTFYWYKPTYNKSFEARSPGKALLYELFSWCHQQKLTTFDFTVGDEAFKLHYKNQDVAIKRYCSAHKPWFAAYMSIARLFSKRS